MNNAGVGGSYSVLEMTLDEWRLLVDTSLTGSFLCAKHGARAMIEAGNGGAIINLGSMYSVFGPPRAVGYASAKAGILGLSRALAVELAPHGIRSNAILPGWIETAMTAKPLGGEIGYEVHRTTPAGRFGRPGDLVGAALYLASDASGVRDRDRAARRRRLPRVRAPARRPARQPRPCGIRELEGELMRLTELITIRREELPSLGWLQLVTDEGIVGLGETCLHLDAVEGYLHEVAAPRLLGEEPRDIERHARRLYDSFTGWGGSGAETKGNSAVDVALWDILGQSARASRSTACSAGAAARASAPTTPAPARWYGQVRAAEPIHNWNLPADGVDLSAYEDLDAFLQPGRRARREPARRGPHGDEDLAVRQRRPGARRALDLGPGDARRRSSRSRRCERRSATGSTSWSSCTRSGSPGPAKAIARALEDYEPYWVEDAVKLDDMLAVSRFIDSTPLPCTFGETIGTRARYYELLERCDLGYLMLDLGWCGGLSEAKKVAALAELHGVPIAPHDCTGPIGLTAGTHLAISTPNAVLQESVRAFYRGWYRDLVTELPAVVDGMISPPDGPGLGTALQPDVLERPGTRVRRTRLEDL